MSVRRVAALLLAISAAAAQPCQLPPLKGEKIFPGADAGRFCTGQRLGVREASYQVLADDSGSMRGLVGQMPALLAWIDQALSHMRRFEMTWSRARTCAFSSARPLAGCTGRQLGVGSLKGAGDTTLDEAIASARDYDLTIILTDGAGASGAATRECAGGVDAACVGRSLALALQPRAGEKVELRGGLWMIPLVGHHRGPLFTEQMANPSSIDPAALRQAVTADTKVAVEASGFRRTSSGALLYDYSGPRVFLLFVISRHTDLGRAFVAALQARMEYSQIGRLEKLGDYRGALAALPALELYPGAAAGIRWTGLRVGQPACLTFDARLRKDGKLSVGCSNPRDEAVVTLTAAVAPDSYDCARLLMLPVLRTEIRQDRTLNAVRDFAWRGTAQDPSRPLQLQLRLACSRQWQSRLASSCAAAANIVSRRDLPATVEALVSNKGGNAAMVMLRGVSNSSIIYAPHRAFQLVETLERFYSTLQSLDVSSHEAVLGSLDLCWIQ